MRDELNIMKNKRKSLSLNAILSSLKTLTNILFPLITYPYITRVLSVESIGRVNFAQSIVSYFSLLAALGISTFAVRTGSRIRNNNVEFTIFANRIFSINIISMALSMLLLFALLLFPTRIAEFRTLILILSLTVFLAPFSVDWLYTIYEDFGYITIRNFAVHLLSLILLFCFVKNEKDVYLYVALTTASTSFGNIFNFLHSRKYITFKFTFNTHWKEYKQSILLFFVNSIATTIYLNSDTTLLGLIGTDYSVGLYSVATKIYSILKQMFNAVTSSIIPRLSFLQKNNEDEFCLLLNRYLGFTVLLIVPSGLGIILLRKEIILLISGAEYLEAATTLGILAIATIFAVLANILANGMLVCLGREQFVLKATIVSAIANASLNFLFIPLWGQNGAAITTLIAECLMVIISLYNLRDYISRVIDFVEIRNSVISSAVMFALVLLFVYPALSSTVLIVRILLNIAISCILYLTILMVLRDKIVNEIFKRAFAIFKR